MYKIFDVFFAVSVFVLQGFFQSYFSWLGINDVCTNIKRKGYEKNRRKKTKIAKVKGIFSNLGISSIQHQ